jgi:hypothetical protein
MFDFFNNLLVLNTILYKELQLANMALKKDLIETEMKRPTKKYVISSDKSCQTAFYISNKDTQTQTEINNDVIICIDECIQTDELNEEFIVLDV